MVTVNIPEELARRLEERAQLENRTLDEIVASMLFDQLPSNEMEIGMDEPNPLDAIMGILDTDVTDMSSTVKQTIKDYFQKKYARPD